MTDNVTPIAAAIRGARAAPDFPDDGSEPHGILPPDCPVTALGHQAGTMWLLDAANQLIPLKPDCRKGEVMLLFGGEKYLRTVEKWVQWRAPKKELGEKGPQIAGFDQKLVQADLIEAASRSGIFDPQGMLFGRGAHRRAQDDALLLHAGDKVLIVNAAEVAGRRNLTITERRAGKVDGKIRPAASWTPTGVCRLRLLR